MMQRVIKIQGEWFWADGRRVTIDDALESPLIEPGLVAAWEAAAYTNYGDEDTIDDFVIERFCKKMSNNGDLT